ncbi:MAG TPA: hypothetical protein ENI42_01720, partial [Thermoplasmatales archaeon]|nr:hypothetical protein [Thermoplasmatales archaeon]
MKMGRTLLTSILILTAVVTISITLTAYGTNFNVPDQWNWQNTTYKDITGDWTTPAKDQRPCGSCWAFAAIAAIESVYDIAYEDPNMNLDLSEQYILSCLSSAGDCDSGSTKLAFYYIKSETPQGNDVNGVVPEWCMPYQAVDWVPCEDKCENWTQNLWPIEDYGEFLLDNNDPDDITFLKAKLIEKGPMVTTMTWTTSFSTWGFSHHNPEDYYPYPGPVGYLNHAVLLVGYKDDPSIPNGGYWICKNSWGTDFGYNGFFNVEYGALRVG